MLLCRRRLSPALCSALEVHLLLGLPRSAHGRRGWASPLPSREGVGVGWSVFSSRSRSGAPVTRPTVLRSPHKSPSHLTGAQLGGPGGSPWRTSCPSFMRVAAERRGVVVLFVQIGALCSKNSLPDNYLANRSCAGGGCFSCGLVRFLRSTKADRTSSGPRKRREMCLARRASSSLSQDVNCGRARRPGLLRCFDAHPAIALHRDGQRARSRTTAAETSPPATYEARQLPGVSQLPVSQCPDRVRAGQAQRWSP